MVLDQVLRLVNIFWFVCGVCSMDHSSSVVDFHIKICKSFHGDKKLHLPHQNHILYKGIVNVCHHHSEVQMKLYQ